MNESQDRSLNGSELAIGKVAKVVGVETHTIRYWTEEFAEHITFRVGKGDRKYYSIESVETLKNIKMLLHDKGLKIRALKAHQQLIKNPSGASEMLSAPSQSLNQNIAAKVLASIQRIQEIMNKVLN